MTTALHKEKAEIGQLWRRSPNPSVAAEGRAKKVKVPDKQLRVEWGR